MAVRYVVVAEIAGVPDGGTLTCLTEASVEGERIICPHHGACFDARSGATPGPPAT